MAKKTIEFVGSFDTSKIESQAKKFSQDLENAFSKRGISIIDPSSMDFLRDEAQNGIRAITQELNKLRKEANEYDSAIQKSTKGSKEQNALAARRLELVNKTINLEKNLNDIKSKSQRLDAASGVLNPFNQISETGGPGKRRGPQGRMINVTPGRKGPSLGQGLIDATKTVGSALPTGNGMSSAVVGGAGSIMALGPVLGSLAAVAGIAAAAIGMMAHAAEVYAQQIPTFLKLAAQGQRRAGGVGSATAMQFGFSAQETYATQQSLNMSLGVVGQKSAESRLANVMVASRQFGMDPSQIAGAGNQLRQAGGTQYANKQLAEILNKAITKGMDASQAAHFIEVSSSMLSSINDNGIMSTGAMLESLAQLTKAGLSPEQAAKTLGGMNASVKGATGEAAMFHQQAMALGGLGGGSIFGTQEAMLSGMTGVDVNELVKGMSPEMAKRTRSAFGSEGFNLEGGAGYSQKYARGALERLNQISPDTGSKESLLTRGGIIGKAFGGKSATEGVRILSILEKQAEGKVMTDGDKAIVESLTKDPAAQWRDEVLRRLDIVAGAARGAASSKSALSFSEMNLGEASQGLMNSLRAALTELNTTLLKFLQSDTFTAIMDGLGATVGFIKKAFDEISTQLAKGAVALGEGLGLLFEDPAKFGQELGSGIKGVLETLFDSLKSMLQDLVDRLPSLDAAQEGAAGLLSGVGNFFGGAVKGVNGVTAADESALAGPHGVGKKMELFSTITKTEMSPKDASEFLDMIKAFKKNGSKSEEFKSAAQTFSEEQGAGLSFEKMLEALQKIAVYTEKMAELRKNRKIMPPLPVESVAR